MSFPELTFVAGPNAAGKSSFIRTRISELSDCEIIMTDVYKGRTKAVCYQALQSGRDIILETVFNDASFTMIADEARAAGYHTSLIVLFLDTIQQSIDRVAFRSLEQDGLYISDGNVRINFNEGFKNIATYFFYFDQSDFLYTGNTDENEMVMRFQKTLLTSYKSTELQYPQKISEYAFRQGRLNPEAYKIIKSNTDYTADAENVQKPAMRVRRRLNL
jgi:predicted ABC-type ATPase